MSRREEKRRGEKRKEEKKKRSRNKIERETPRRRRPTFLDGLPVIAAAIARLLISKGGGFVSSSYPTLKERLSRGGGGGRWLQRLPRDATTVSSSG